MSTELIIPAKRLPALRTSGAKLISRKLPVITSMLPSRVDKTAFCASALMEANKLDEDVDQTSIVASAMHAATMGLLLGPAAGQAYFIPFRDRKRGNRRFCQLVPGYRGYAELAYANNFLAMISADVVLQGEECSMWHDEKGRHLNHQLPIERDLQKKNVIAAYCTYTTTRNASNVVLVTRKELDDIDTGKNVWASNPLAMYLKTPCRRASKLWQLTPQQALAVHLDECFERGEMQPLPEELDLPDEEPDAAVDDFPHPLVTKMIDRIGELNSEEDVQEFWQEFDPPFQAEGLTDAEKQRVRDELEKRRVTWN